ncbi:MAG: nucleotidyltransferase family protein [Bacillota bacterium]|nr:nucleotidyltransferase family protein [Bacillota bacterium]
MKAAGIIAEYNPFHNGHRYHLEETRALTGAEAVVAVMSGDFTQRGEPAAWDKWHRARMAVDNGADLVLELPFVFACNHGEGFAAGGVGLLDRLGCVEWLSFGSESGSLEELEAAASFLAEEGPAFRQTLRECLDGGMSYPRAREAALRAAGKEKEASLLLLPNNILAVEYLKELRRRGSRMKAVTVPRKGGAYNDEAGEAPYASAAACRRRLEAGEETAALEDVLPPETIAVLGEALRWDEDASRRLYAMTAYRILTGREEELREILSAGEGLENRLKKAVTEEGCRDMRTLTALAGSKRYTAARIRRLLVHSLAGLTGEAWEELIREEILYARVLGLSRTGARLLRHIKKTGCASVPVLTNVNKELSPGEPAEKLLKYDILASRLWHLAAEGSLYARSDYIMGPYVKK